MEDNTNQHQLNKGFRVLQVIWGALLFSLAVYVLACKLIEEQNIHTVTTQDFPLDTLKLALYGASFITLVIANFLKKILLNRDNKMKWLQAQQNISIHNQHPAVGRYSAVIIILAALSESIGIYGVVLFLLSKSSLILYQFITISAASMIYFRPRKEELFQLASTMKS